MWHRVGRLHAAVEVGMNASTSVLDSHSCKVQISVSQVQFNSRLHVKRLAGLWMWAAPPLIFMQGTRRGFSQIHTQVFLGVWLCRRLHVLRLGSMNVGKGEGDVGRLISQANIRFAYLDSQRRGRVLQEILSWLPSHLSQEFCLCIESTAHHNENIK